MSNALAYLIEKFKIDTGQPSPISIPNVGRNDLADLFRELKFTKGAEIGVKTGLYSEILLKANPNLYLFGIDPYEEYEAYRTRSQAHQDQCRAEAYERLGPYISSGRYKLVEKASVEASRSTVTDLNNPELYGFSDGSLDFIYIDASHKFEDVVADIAAWSRVVRSGGCLAGHDFMRRKHGRGGGPNTSHHVVEAVTGWTNAYKISPWFVLGRLEKREGEVRDRERSWMWVKS